MKKKSKIVIARIMAILMMLSILPYDTLGIANVVMAEEFEESADTALNGDAGELNNDSYLQVDSPVSVGGLQEDVLDSEDTSGEDVNGTNEETQNNADDSGIAAGDVQQSEEPAEDADAAGKETAAPSDDVGEAAPSNDDTAEVKTYIFDPEGLEEKSYTANTSLGDNEYFTIMANSSKGAAIVKYSDVTTNIGTSTDPEYVGCYDSLNWNGYGSDTNNNIVNSSRTKAIRITGGSIGFNSNVPVNCIKITTKYPNARLVMYSSPKDVSGKESKIEVYKLASSTAFEKNASYSGTSNTNPKVIKDDITIKEAGEYYIGFSSGGGVIFYMEVTEDPNATGDSGSSGSGTQSGLTLTYDSPITDVKTVGTVSFSDKSSAEAVSAKNVKITAEKLDAATSNIITAEIKAAVKTASDNLMAGFSDPDAEPIVDYYDLNLVNKDDGASDQALQLSAGAIQFKLPYPTGVKRTTEIVVLHGKDTLAADKVKKEADGFWVEADSFSPYTVIIKPTPAAEAGTVDLNVAEGYEEGAYAEWEPYSGADGYVAYVSKNKDSFTESDRIDNELIREYSDHWRVDTVGLAAGTYYIKVSAVTVDGTDSSGNKQLSEIATVTTGALTVTNYEREGFAFSNESPQQTASGAYNDNGTLRSGAQVIYVTAKTAKTCKATVNGTEYTGIQAILTAKEKNDSPNDILDFRIIGCITKDDLDSVGSSDQGLQVKGKGNYSVMNITIEGIGEDATVWGFGFLIRGCANVEFRNFGILNCMDDGVSIDTNNCNLWMHDLDIFYGKEGSGDKKKGDGALDIKKSQYCTVSYVHFWDTGKSCLLDAQEASSGGSNYITYHHNWFDHSDSRHPRVRNASAVHVYNNYFDGNAKYGVGSTTGSSTFVEANYFRNCANPMMIADQGTDAKGEGTFSSESGGMIKAYNNHIEGEKSYIPYSSTNTTEFDAYEVDDKSKKVPTDVTTRAGKSYSNFDTDSTMYTYTADTPETARQKVIDHAGRLGMGDLQWTFDASEDSNYDIIPGLQSAVLNYKSSVKSIGGIDGVVTGSTGGNTGGDNGDDNGNGSGGSTTPGGTASAYVHNFTGSDGKYTDSNSFFKFTGNKQSSPNTVKYTDVNGNELTLSQAMKMESSTKIEFTAPSSGTLIMVFDTDFNGGTKINDSKKADYPATNGVLMVKLAEGPYTIEKGDTANLYYIAFIPDNTGGPDGPGGGDDDLPQAAAPTAEPGSGIIDKGTSVALKTTSEGADIYYTTDGSDPKESGYSYFDGAIVIDRSTTVKAYAKGDGYKDSNVATFEYIVRNDGITTTTTHEFNAKKIAEEKNYKDRVVNGAVAIEESTQYGTDDYFTVVAKSGKAVSFQTADSNGVSVAAEAPANSVSETGYTTYDWRFKYGGSSASDYRYIKFTNDGTAKVTVCAYVPSDKVSDGREIALDDDKQLLTATPTEYVFNNVAAGTHSIKAITNDHYILYIVVEEVVSSSAAPTPETYDAKITANPMPTSTPLESAIDVELDWEDKSDLLFYTLDGTDPSLAANPARKQYTAGTTIIHITETTTIKAVAQKADGSKYSQVVSFEYTFKEDKDDNEPEPEPIVHKITVDMGYNSITKIIEVIDGNKINPDDLPSTEREGYIFAGWVDEQDRLINLATFVPNGDMKIKATWTEITVDETKYSIIVDRADGTAEEEILVDKDNPQLTKDILPDPVREGYEFTGWVDGTGTKVELPVAISGNMRLTATWRKKESENNPTDQVGLYIIGLEPEYVFTGAKIIPDIQVVDYDIDKGYDEDGNGDILTPGVDYTVKYSNNVKLTAGNKAGKAKVTVTGKGNYKGTKAEKTFDIVAAENKYIETTELANLKGAKVGKIDNKEYTGEGIYPDFELTLKGEQAVTYTYDPEQGIYVTKSGGEYIKANVAVSNNVNKGTATIYLTGAQEKNKATSVKKTFKITAVDISKAKITKDEQKTPSGVYAVKGATPDDDSLEVTITLGTGDDAKEVILRKGIDYTVKYTNNKKAGTDASMVITGKGNYTKKLTGGTFKVNKLDMDGLSIAVSAYEGVKTDKVKATVLDAQGNALKAKQYTVKVYGEDGETPYAQAKLTKDDTVVIVAEAKDTENLEGATEPVTLKVGANIGKAKFKLKKVGNKTLTKTYTGEPIELSKDDLEVTMKGANGAITYEIVGYTNNINTGTATAYIQGTGEYGGTNKVKFKIVGKEVTTLKDLLDELFN